MDASEYKEYIFGMLFLKRASEAIILRLQSLNRRLEILRRESGKLNYQKLGLMQDLLTGKVPVKVDEPVAETADA